jgi:hypothetical protein
VLGVLGKGYSVFLQIGTNEKRLYPAIFENLDLFVSQAVGLGMACFCGLCLVLVVPLCFVQVTNICKNTTTHERFAAQIHRVTFPQNEVPSPNIRERNSLLSDISDTNSMLLQPEEQWAFFSGTTLSKSYSSRNRIQVFQERRCCGLCVKREVQIEPDSPVIEEAHNNQSG